MCTAASLGRVLGTHGYDAGGSAPKCQPTGRPVTCRTTFF